MLLLHAIYFMYTAQLEVHTKDQKTTQYRIWFLKQPTSIFPLLSAALLALFENSAVLVFFSPRYIKCKLSSFENPASPISQMYHFWYSCMLCRKKYPETMIKACTPWSFIHSSTSLIKNPLLTTQLFFFSPYSNPFTQCASGLPHWFTRKKEEKGISCFSPLAAHQRIQYVFLNTKSSQMWSYWPKA